MRVVIYLRLSSEDRDIQEKGKTESNSIAHQRWLLTDFVRNHPDLCGAELDELCDDGWSGKNFERPGMVELLEQVRRGTVQCIVVKDFSRFGRDYLTVGNYISRVFPFMGVRFISVNDGFDSARPGDIDSLDTYLRPLQPRAVPKGQGRQETAGRTGTVPQSVCALWVRQRRSG